MTDRPALIGLDIGSGSTKVVVYDETGVALAEARHPYAPRQDRPGVAEYDPATILRTTELALKEAVERSGVSADDVIAVGIASMVAGLMGVSAAGEPTSPYTTTLDVRFADQMDWAVREAGDDIRRLCGSGIPALAAKLRWLRAEFPEVDRRTARYGTINAYVHGALTGISGHDLVIEHSMLWCSGLADVERHAWDDGLCTALGIGVERLPRIVDSGRHVGRLTPEVAGRTGLLAGTPVVLGAGDQCAGFLASGLDRPTVVGEIAGTYPTIATVMSTFRPDLVERAIEIFPSVVPGRWHPVFFIGGGGLTHLWFLDTWVPEARPAGSPWPAVPDDLLREAESVPPGSEGLIFVPHLGGRASPADSAMRGAWLGFSWTHRRGHFYRALLESIAHEQRLALERMQRHDPAIDPQEVVLYGGSGRSGVWNGIKADVMGLPYRRLVNDAVPLGAAILGGFGVGYFDDLDAAAARLQGGLGTERFTPDPERHATYRGLTAAYGRTVDAMSAPFRAAAGGA